MPLVHSVYMGFPSMMPTCFLTAHLIGLYFLVITQEKGWRTVSGVKKGLYLVEMLSLYAELKTALS